MGKHNTGSFMEKQDLSDIHRLEAVLATVERTDGLLKSCVSVIHVNFHGSGLPMDEAVLLERMDGMWHCPMWPCSDLVAIKRSHGGAG